MKAWKEMSVAERIELTLRCMGATLPEHPKEASKIAKAGMKVYDAERVHGFEQASVKARVEVIEMILQE